MVVLIAVIFTNWKTSRMWVAVQELSISKLLTRMVKHASSLWVALDVWADLMRMLNMHLASELLSWVWADQNHLSNWVNTPASKSSSRLSRSEPLRKGEHTSREWVPLQYLNRSEPLTRMDEHHPASESLSSIWADQNHWREWLNTNSESESLSSV